MADFPTTIFICEKGDLEIKAALLAASLRNVCSNQIELICGIPEVKSGITHPAKNTIRFLESLDIRIVPFNNPMTEKKTAQDPGSRFSNKFFCFPKELNKGKIMFLDSDMFCLRKPDLVLGAGAKFLVSQAFHSLELDWPDLYSRMNITEPFSREKSILDHKIGYPYFNSGFWVVEGSILEFLLQEWKQIFRALRTVLTDRQHLHHTDQISLTLAVQKLGITYEILPADYNYPSGSFPINGQPYFAHYHGPEKIARDPELYKSVMNLTRKYPGLKEIASQFPFWKEMIDRRMNKGLLNMAYKVKKNIKGRLKPFG